MPLSALCLSGLQKAAELLATAGGYAGRGLTFDQIQLGLAKIPRA